MKQPGTDYSVQPPTKLLGAVAVGLLIVAAFSAMGQVDRQSYHVDYVVDGDTFYVHGLTQSVRLLNIDAYEAGTPRGDEATRLMRSWIEGRTVSLDCLDELDKYGRALCTAREGQSDVGERLVRLGLAERWQS